MKRRSFMGKAALGLVTLSGVMAAISYFRQFFPRLAGEKRRIVLDDLRKYPVDTFTFLEEHNLYVYRDHEGIKAVSAICTHLGCILEKGMDGFECPCHGSCYNNDGEVLSGPAPHNLAWYRVSRDASGKIVIDPGKSVSSSDKFLSS
ncbi:MAG: ubiquinol-cytochrome c reductase iron-sulfur subunit [Bacteroidales bacterium]|nr:ubiquinol-cytochrome c reductase iron-sulfur subunit [Bacteroidales bacterium]